MRKMQKMHVKIGDSVKIISGSDKNKIGEVIKLYRSTGKILVKGIILNINMLNQTPKTMLVKLNNLKRLFIIQMLN